MQAIGQMLKAFDNGLTRIRNGFTNGVQHLFGDRFTFVFSRCIIAIVATVILVKRLLGILNKITFNLEKVLVVIATLAMTALVFNVYLIEQKTAFTSTSTSDAASETEKKSVPTAPGVLNDTVPVTTPKQLLDTGSVEVLLLGDAQNVQIIREGVALDLPGTVERGSYDIRALFDGWDEQGEAGTIKLVGEGPLTVKCDSFTENCRVKKKPFARPKPPAADKKVHTGAVQVDVLGAPLSVELRRGDEVFTVPGPNNPGDYTVFAQFDGWDAAQEVGNVTIAHPGPVSLKCDPFTETCRIKKKQTRPSFLPPQNAKVAESKNADKQPIVPIPTRARGDGSKHELNGNGETYSLPTTVPPGHYVVRATFPNIGEVTAGSLTIEEGQAEAVIYCDEQAWQCVDDQGWWDVWSGEGQINLALMLMVAMGFLGASIATVEGKHLAVDATGKILSPRPARLVKRFTGLIAAGLCFILMAASWEKIIDPESSGSTFPGAKVWWWMVRPINWMTQWLPGEKYGPSTAYTGRSKWEDAMIAQGEEWPFGLAFSYVQQGDGFPLWIPLVFLLAAFGIMGLRFSGQVITPLVTSSPFRGGTRKPADVIVAGIFPGVLIALGLSVWFGQGFMIIVAALILVFMGSPLFIAVGVATLAGWLLLKDASATTIVSDMFEATKKQEIIAIPFFVLAGNIMTHGSIAKRLIAFAQALVGPLPGGLGVSAVFACAVFAAISGSSPATVIAIGSIMFPMLVKKGYSENFSLGLLSTSGSLGIIIPPSVPMIIYAVMVSNPSGPVGILSPTELFLGGVAPGLFIALALIAYTLYKNWPRPADHDAIGSENSKNRLQALPWLTTPSVDFGEGVETKEDSESYWTTLALSFIRGIPSLMLPVLVLGGIYGGFGWLGLPIAFDVTQAAAIAVVYALFVELFIHRELKFSDVGGVCIETASMIGSLFLILVIAISLNKLLVLLEVPQYATETMLQYTTSPLTFLIAVNIFLLLLGCVMDIISAILIVAPLLAPIAAQYGIHPIHFGIMFIVNLELGYLTPPMGINLFVASTTFERSLVQVIRSIIPFLLVMLFCLFCVIWIPRWFQTMTCVEVPGLPAFTEQYLIDEQLCQP